MITPDYFWLPPDFVESAFPRICLQEERPSLSQFPELKLTILMNVQSIYRQKQLD